MPRAAWSCSAKHLASLRSKGSAEDQLAGPKGLVEGFEEQTAEQAGQHADRQEEARSAAHPALAVGRQPAAGHDAVQVGMVLQGLTPGVQHRDEADLGAEVSRVGRDGAQRRGRAAEQDVVDGALVLQGDRGDGFGEGEDDVEVRHGQQVGLAGLQPQGAGQRLALGTVAVSAGV